MKVDCCSILLSVLIGTFAIGSWIDMNGIWVELPLLVNILSEGWQLPTYIVAIVQIANIAPIIYLAVHHSRKKSVQSERWTIYLILSMGCLCCALLAIFWQHTVTVASGKSVSVAFFVLIALLSMVDTTSSVTFLPYLAHHSRRFVTALYVGEGLSGLLPAVAGLIQGVGDDPKCFNVTEVMNGTNHTKLVWSRSEPRFSVSVFFGLLCVMMILCLCAFAAVDNVPHFSRYINTKSRSVSTGLASTESSFAAATERGNSDSLISRSVKMHNSSTTSDADRPHSRDLCHTRRASRCFSVIYVILIGAINFFTNGVLPSVQNYSLMPYSTYLYHLVVTLSQILNPLACLLTLHPWRPGPRLTFALAALATTGSAYLIMLAVFSPHALLGHIWLGPVLAAGCWLLVGVVFAFLKTVIALELQTSGHSWLQLCGISTQLGSAMGALLTFILVGVLNLLKTKPLSCLS